MPIIEVNGLSAGYGNGYVIRDVSFSLEAGGFTAVLGRNGSGKSTLIKALQKLTPERTGQVGLGGKELDRLGARDIASKVAYVPQLSGLAFDFTVGEMVAMGRFAHRRRLAPLTEEDRRAIDTACESTGTSGFRDKPLTSLSGGERQRVFIARALAQRTPILMLDEPSLHLDINYQVEIFAMLKRLQTEQGKTILLAEHNINLAAGYADRLIFLKDGLMAGSGTPAETVDRKMMAEIFGAEVDVRTNPSTGLPEISLIMGKPEGHNIVSPNSENGR